MTSEFTGLTAEEARAYCAGSEAQSVRDVIAARVGSRTVIDVGCGNGIDSDRYSPTQYLGVDLSPVLIAAASGLHPDHSFAVADLRQPAPWWMNGAQVTIVKSVLEHVASESEAISILENAWHHSSTVFVAWHTPPVDAYVSEIVRVPGHFGRTVNQNRYARQAFAHFLRRAKVEQVENFELWEIGG